MDREWKDLRSLRRGSLGFAGQSYSGCFVAAHNIEDKARSHSGLLPPFELYNRIEEEKITREEWEEKRRQYLKSSWFWVPEPVEVRADENGRCLCRYNPGLDRKKPQEIFDTSFGRFVSHDQGEFGGDMVLPDGKIMVGNFCEIVECGGMVYGIDSCNHMGVGHISVYAFDASMSPQLLYSRGMMASLFTAYMGLLPKEEKADDGLSEIDKAMMEQISFNAFCRSDKSFFVILSGHVRRGAEEEWQDVTRLLQCKDGRLIQAAEFKYALPHVYSMAVHGGELVLGFDKVAAVVEWDGTPKEVYTIIDTEAEEDILRMKRR